jgi:hypothetical protein
LTPRKVTIGGALWVTADTLRKAQHLRPGRWHALLSYSHHR